MTKCSEILLAVVLITFAVLIWFLMNGCSSPDTPIETPSSTSNVATLVSTMLATTSAPAPEETFVNAQPVIKYEGFLNVEGVSDSVYGAAPFKNNEPVADINYKSVNYTGLVNGTPGEVIQIEGTDLLTAPLVDNMLYTNSIANVNRNASQDIRGDIPVQFNDSYTPFNTSTIYGAPLSLHSMTIGTTA